MFGGVQIGAVWFYIKLWSIGAVTYNPSTKMNGSESQRTPQLLELLDTHVFFSGSVKRGSDRWRLLGYSSCMIFRGNFGTGNQWKLQDSILQFSYFKKKIHKNKYIHCSGMLRPSSISKKNHPWKIPPIPWKYGRSEKNLWTNHLRTNPPFPYTSKPRCSMYGIFTYIYHQNYPNVGK